MVWTTTLDHGPAALNRDEIIFAVEQPADGEGRGGGYFVYSLSESAEDGEGDPFKLSRTSFDSLDGPDQDVLEGLVLDWQAVPEYLNKNLEVVVSTRSGTGRAMGFWRVVLQPLLSEVLGDGSDSSSGSDGYRSRCRVTVTSSADTIREFARGLRGDDGETVVLLLSGDGGVVDLLNGLSDDGETTKVTVGVLPLGTGNALFSSLHKPLYGEKGPSGLVLGLRTLFLGGGRAEALPTFRAEFSRGAVLVGAPGADAATDVGTGERSNAAQVQVDHLIGAIVASYGFHASLVWESDTPSYRRHGAKRFGMAAAELLKESHAYDATLDIVSPSSPTYTRVRHTSGTGNKFNYILATMVSNLERGFTISPESKPIDGKLRVVHFGDVGGERTMEIMMGGYRGGEHVGMRWKDEDEKEDGVGYEEVEEMRVTIYEEDSRWRKVCVDGTIVEVPRGGWMTVRREVGVERSRVLVPRDVV
ncbi:ATP-NAD kinase-like domain-containing protein [Echria macrotheca]|uniref:ATP-NAD kinase-like domain-containing protein n=1 Tax=Echria macrotheca TaxID=438768 RepID=A0AAJ0B838_9PEZI|nr:ATP-NAD kinase-like domain-containing protein [Echria macrotheca]